MKRFIMAMAATSCLAVVYQVYAQWFDSIIGFEEQNRAEIPADPDERPAQPLDLLEIAREWLPDEEWAQHPNYAFERSDNVYIYADNALLPFTDSGKIDKRQLERVLAARIDDGDLG